MGKRINEREGEGRKRGGRGGILKENIGSGECGGNGRRG